MHRLYWPKRLLSLFGILVLAACATPQQLKDPAYAPTLPSIAPPVTATTGGIYNPATNVHLFEDVKARRSGDLITVILREKTAASKKVDTTTDKKTAIEVGIPTLFGQQIEQLSASAEKDVNFSGEGAASQSNSLSGDITVTVAGVYPNGNLLIRGEKLLTLNQGSEVVRISGIVRPIDVSPANTVLSSQIGNVEITYSGNGFVQDSNLPGWITRLFNLALFLL